MAAWKAVTKAASMADCLAGSWVSLRVEQWADSKAGKSGYTWAVWTVDCWVVC